MSDDFDIIDGTNSLIIFVSQDRVQIDICEATDLYLAPVFVHRGEMISEDRQTDHRTRSLAKLNPFETYCGIVRSLCRDTEISSY